MDKYLKELESYEQTPAIRAAIELMRAAQPKDPAAEREHCEQAYKQLLLEDRHPVPVVDLLMRERAAALASGYLQAKAKYRDGIEIEMLEDKLSAAQRDAKKIAEYLQSQWDRAQDELDNERDRSRGIASERAEAEAKLSAAQAEIERLKARLERSQRLETRYRMLADERAEKIVNLEAGFMDDLSETRDALETKLTNLRTAAERALAILGESEIAWHLRAMVEASR